VIREARNKPAAKSDALLAADWLLLLPRAGFIWQNQI